MFFATSAIGLVLLSRRLARDPRWRGLSRYVLTAGVASVAGFVLIGAMVMPDGAPLNPYAGVFQRALILVVLFPCRMILCPPYTAGGARPAVGCHDPLMGPRSL